MIQPIDAFFDCRIVGDKNVYVVDDHHKALAAWVVERRKLERAPNLLTIDHHTDVMEAFLGHATCAAFVDPQGDAIAARNTLLAQLDWKSNDSVADSIKLLRHDEHIHAATMSGIVDSAFCIQLSDSDGTPSLEKLAYDAQTEANFELRLPNGAPPQRPMTYAPTPDRIYVISFACAIGCDKRPYDDECEIHHAREIIETRYLDDQLARGAEIARCLGLADLESAPYILDIDLDAFHSKKATEPDDATTLHRLIRNAVAITIATESKCVEELWHDGDCILGNDELLKRIMVHIEASLNGEAHR